MDIYRKVINKEVTSLTMYRPSPVFKNAIPRLLDVMVIVLVFVISGASTTVPIDCYNANRTCYSQARRECMNQMEILYKVCGRNIDVCESRTVNFCQSHLKTVKLITVFRECYCPDSLGSNYHQCDNIWRTIFQNPCAQKVATSDPQLPQTNEAAKQNRDREPKLEAEDDIFGRPLRPLVPSVDRGINCLDVQKDCDRSKQCLKNIADFRKACSIKECGKNSDHCLAVYEKVRAFNVFNCGCQRIINRDQCENFRAQFLQNKCLSFLNTQATQGGNSMRNGDGGAHSGTSTRSSTATRPAVDDGDPRAPNSRRISESSREWRGRRRQRANCHNVLRQCISRHQCLYQLEAMNEHCRTAQPSRSMCRPGSSCMTRLSSFYSSLDNIAREALTCDCEEGDPMCSHARELLRPPCAYMDSGKTCNEAFAICQRSACQTRYDDYQARCRPKFQCTTADRKRCLDGIATLMGTILTQRCSCNSPSFKPGEKTTCEQLKRRIEKPSCLQNGFEVKLKPPANARKDYINGNTICKLRREFFSVYTLPQVRIDHNSSCSELCECSGMHSISKQCTAISHCSSRVYTGKQSLCEQWLRGTDARRNRRRDCTCVPGEGARTRAACLSKEDVMKRIRSPGIYVSVLYSRVEQARLASATHEVYDLRTLGRSLDKLLDALTRRRSHHWQNCRLQLVRRVADIAIYRLVNVQRHCRTRKLLLKLMASADFPIIRHHPLLSIIRKVLLTTDRDRYLPVVVKNNARWAQGRGYTTIGPGGAADTTRGRVLEVSLLALCIVGLIRGRHV